MKTKTVAFFVTSLNSGGIENYLLRFLNFSKDEVQATVYCKSGVLGDLEQEYLNVGAKLKPFKLGMFSAHDFYKLYKELKRQEYNAIVDFTGNFAAFPLLVAKKVGIEKRVAFYRGSTNRFKDDVLRLAYNNFANKQIPKVATSILSNSKAAFEFFFKDQWKDDKRFQVIYNGIDAKSFLSTTENLRTELDIPKNVFVVGHVGRFNVAKNHKTMIQVAINMCLDDPNTYFVFCGDKVVEGLKNEVDAHKLGEQIKLLGFRMDVIKVLNTLDCFYFPSLTEGQPNALIEAMVAGIPFVASDIDPIKETVPLELFSQLIAPENSALAQEKINTIKNKQDILKFEGLSANISKKYNAEQLFNQFYQHL